MLNRRGLSSSVGTGVARPTFLPPVNAALPAPAPAPALAPAPAPAAPASPLSPAASEPPAATRSAWTVRANLDSVEMMRTENSRPCTLVMLSTCRARVWRLRFAWDRMTCIWRK